MMSATQPTSLLPDSGIGRISLRGRVARATRTIAPAALFGIAGLSGVVGLGMRLVPPRIEAHLQSDIRGSALVDLPQVHVRVDGRDAVLTGTIATSQERDALIAQVAGRWGVRSVRADGLRIVPEVSPSSAGGRDASARAGATTRASNPATVAIPRLGSSSVARSSAVPSPVIASTVVPPTPVVLVATTTATTATTVAGSQPTAGAAALDGLDAFDRDAASLLASRPIQFIKGSAALPAVNDAVVAALAARVAQMPPGVRFQVRAHTDASGPALANLQLSQARADVFLGALVARGVPAGALSAVGVGAAEPVASNATPEGRLRNRRIEVRAQRSAA